MHFYTFEKLFSSVHLSLAFLLFILFALNVNHNLIKQIKTDTNSY